LRTRIDETVYPRGARILVAQAYAVADLRDHARTARHHAFDQLRINAEIGGGHAALVAHVHVRDRDASVVAIMKVLDDVLGLLRECRVGFAPVQAAGCRHGDDDFSRVGQVWFQVFLLCTGAVTRNVLA
jgi:hypothetical protein